MPTVLRQVVYISLRPQKILTLTQFLTLWPFTFEPSEIVLLVMSGRKPLPSQRDNQAPSRDNSPQGASAGHYHSRPPSRPLASTSQEAYGGSPRNQQRGLPPKQQPAQGQQEAVGPAENPSRLFRITKSPNEEFIVTNLYGSVSPRKSIIRVSEG